MQNEKIEFGKYLIKKEGTVTNIKKKKVLIGSVNKKGYLRYTLCYNGVKFRISAHRFVALTFIPNPYLKPQINHIDGNKLNNHYKNLEWCTNSENAIHSYQVLGKKPNKTGTGKFNELHSRSKKIKQLTLNGNLIRVWVCANEVKRQLGYSRGNICSCARGEKQSSNGFKWEYV